MVKMKIINKEYTVNSTVNKCIVLISDIHYNDKRDIKRLNKILDNIKKIKPNFICIPGDIIDKSTIDDEDILISWIEELSNVAKTIISIGNHEFYINKSKKIFGLNSNFYNKLRNIKGIYVLDNSNLIIDKINFIGITENPLLLEDKTYQTINDFNKSLSYFNSDKYYNIVLCHSPIHISDERVLNGKKINLVLCGHMHGGAVLPILRPLFKSNGLVSPTKELFPKNVYGKFTKKDTDIIITSGLRVIPIKVINKLFYPEIVKINLINKKR